MIDLSDKIKATADGVCIEPALALWMSTVFRRNGIGRDPGTALAFASWAQAFENASFGYYDRLRDQGCWFEDAYAGGRAKEAGK